MTTPTGDAVPERALPPRPAFAHASEAEMARILDFYDVRWEYEPHAFPLMWNLDGDVVESFSPDFYLPDLDLYLEMTTLRQRLVRKKNRKLRRLRELYPDLRIKLFYARDFRALMLKYGKLALVGALSGTPGQVVPPGRPAAPSSAAGEPVPGGAPATSAARAVHAAAGVASSTAGPTTGERRSPRRRRPNRSPSPAGAESPLGAAEGPPEQREVAR